MPSADITIGGERMALRDADGELLCNAWLNVAGKRQAWLNGLVVRITWHGPDDPENTKVFVDKPDGGGIQ